MTEEGLRSGEFVRVLPDRAHAAQAGHAIYPAAPRVPERTRILAGLHDEALAPF